MLMNAGRQLLRMHSIVISIVTWYAFDAYAQFLQWIVFSGYDAYWQDPIGSNWIQLDCNELRSHWMSLDDSVAITVGPLAGNCRPLRCTWCRVRSGPLHDGWRSENVQIALKLSNKRRSHRQLSAGKPPQKSISLSNRMPEKGERCC